ncbi:acid phosphatase, putative [Plasmodium ovale wallikeri]|uniref:Acid phosphatase, putative n=1 Tax=Plasmodium ovale wallikeri TaxID=864142 RepID=A0A1A8YQI9_PLAOA|nr:acid phosphatase, putative [Plasmodium ovale wallikeri]
MLNFKNEERLGKKNNLGTCFLKNCDHDMSSKSDSKISEKRNCTAIDIKYKQKAYLFLLRYNLKRKKARNKILKAGDSACVYTEVQPILATRVLCTNGAKRDGGAAYGGAAYGGAAYGGAAYGGAAYGGAAYGGDGGAAYGGAAYG